MADQVLYSGVGCITDLMVKEGLINLDFADVRAVMREMGKAMMGTGEASGEKRAISAAEAAISNPLIDDACMKGAKGLVISITGGKDLTLYEVDEAATRIREEVDQDANIIVGATFDEALEGIIRISVVATGIDQAAVSRTTPPETRLAEPTHRIRSDQQRTEPPRGATEQPLATPTIPTAQVQQRMEAIETAANAAVAAASCRVTRTCSFGLFRRSLPCSPSGELRLKKPHRQRPSFRQLQNQVRCCRDECPASTNCRDRHRHRFVRNGVSRWIRKTMRNGSSVSFTALPQ